MENVMVPSQAIYHNVYVTHNMYCAVLGMGVCSVYMTKFHSAYVLMDGWGVVSLYSKNQMSWVKKALHTVLQVYSQKAAGPLNKIL